MVDFQIRVVGLDELLDNLDRLPDDLTPHITRGLVKAASEAVFQMQESISESYPPPSVPGEPPHVRTGTLRRSARIERVEPNRVEIAVGGIGAGAPYASHLEFGTTKMEPRPFIEPVIRRIEPEIPNIILEEVNKGLEMEV